MSIRTQLQPWSNFIFSTAIQHDLDIGHRGHLRTNKCNGTVKHSTYEVLVHWKFCKKSAPNDPKPNSSNRSSKVPTYMCTVVSRFPNFVCFALQLGVFKIFHILGFLTDSHVKISKYHKIFKTWLIAKKSNSLYSTMVANVYPHSNTRDYAATWYTGYRIRHEIDHTELSPDRLANHPKSKKKRP